MTRHTFYGLSELSYAQALAMYVVVGRGRVTTVRQCPTAQFLALVRKALPEKDKDEWRGLDFSHMTARWWILNRILELGAELPATESWSDAQAKAKADTVT